MAGVGAFPYNTFPITHLVSAGGMAVVFIALICLLPSFSRAFLAMSFAFLGAMLVSLILFKWADYLSLTAFELVAAVIIFSWLVVFIRQIAIGLNTKLKTEVTPRLPKTA